VKPLRSRVIRPLRKLHRWLGVGAAAFLTLLAATGVLLNHSNSLGLDTRFLANGWLLDHYGVGLPEMQASFDVAGRRVTQLGEQLYLDASPIRLALPELLGAVELDGYVAVASVGELVVLTPAGEVLERWPLETEVGNGLDAIASTDSGIVLKTEQGLYLFDFEAAAVEKFDGGGTAFDWADASVPGPELAAAIEADYRSRVLSLERLLLDVHSGRLAGLSGVIIADLAAAAVLFLAVSGFIMWMRR
jgi:hypothetical protein